VFGLSEIYRKELVSIPDTTHDCELCEDEGCLECDDSLIDDDDGGSGDSNGGNGQGDGNNTTHPETPTDPLTDKKMIWLLIRDKPTILVTPHLENNEIWTTNSDTELESKIKELLKVYAKPQIIPSKNLQWMVDVILDIL
jgi:hypothetical protein